jgi:hypothetical protein
VAEDESLIQGPAVVLVLQRHRAVAVREVPRSSGRD